MAHLVQYTCTIAHQGLSDAALSTYYTYLKSASSLSNLLLSDSIITSAGL